MARLSLVEYLDITASPWRADSASWYMPDDDYVVAISPGGEKVIFSDNKWCFFSRGVAANKSNHIALAYKNEPDSPLAMSNLKQSKSILLALDRHAYKSPGEPLGIASMNRYNLALQHVRRACLESRSSLFEVLSDSDKLAEAYELYYKNAPASSSGLYDLVVKLSSMPIRYVGFRPGLIPFVMERSPSGDAAREFHQTEIIPTAIYLDLLLKYKEVVKDYLAAKEKLLQLTLSICANEHYARDGKRHRGKSVTFEEALEAVGLVEYAKKYSVTSVIELQRHFGSVYYASIMLIYAFTGMRKSEAYSLTLTSLKHKMNGGVVVARGLYGFTTKFRGVRKRVIWYTSVDVEAPFEAASYICKNIMKCNNVDVERQYLFVSTSYFPFSSSRAKLSTLTSNSPICGNYEPSKYQMHFSPVAIREDHIDELRTLNPFRVWESEDDFQLGSQWPLKIHQLRRSTAVYAMASGLVSLAALKEMLKHLTLAMSRYYAKGSIYAFNILKRNDGDKDAWIRRYQESELFVRSFQYVKELIIPDEVLKGPAGTWIERNSKPLLKSIGYAESLEDTLSKMKKGQIFYRPTPVGGCTLNGVCEKRISVSFIGCDGCSNSAVIQTKLIRLIAIQEKVVQRLESRAEFQFENNTLNELKEFADKLRVA
ncbi:hypothetical protein HX824_25980 [Pseudomonas sp. D4002]|uniref:hypothetical protein n=1 Tax=Pseudomonas sp. D4002 TaxID=2738817 RepID=UPI0015A147B8|nr:hypothetical protein [Pseudomonas sp. D4002]NWB24080.1 hypothetical protein [Pseudomonas sp. D4002]